jgi:hypothetical protein
MYDKLDEYLSELKQIQRSLGTLNKNKKLQSHQIENLETLKKLADEIEREINSGRQLKGAEFFKAGEKALVTGDAISFEDFLQAMFDYKLDMVTNLPSRPETMDFEALMTRYFTKIRPRNLLVLPEYVPELRAYLERYILDDGAGNAADLLTMTQQLQPYIKKFFEELWGN